VSVTGVVQEGRVQNRTSWFYVDVKDDRGKVSTWGFSASLRPS